jgi:hypothetical protein
MIKKGIKGGVKSGDTGGFLLLQNEYSKLQNFLEPAMFCHLAVLI